MSARRGFMIALVLALAACGAAPSDTTRVASRRPSPSPVPEVITPVVASALAEPHPVDGADGKVHLPYELFVTNPTSSVMTINRVETLEASRHEGSVSSANGAPVIAVLDGVALENAIKPLVPTTTTELQPAQVTRVFLDATFPKGKKPPAVIEHRLSVSLKPAEGASQTAQVVTGRTRVIRDSAVVIGPPLEGGRWVVGGGCCFPPSYHRTATLPVNGAFHAPERFAIDFVQLNAQGRLFTGAVGQLSNYPYFGAKIISVADGVVVGLQDGLPEQTPPNLPADATAQTAGGNYLVIDIGHGRFAFYAHMQPGSLRAKVGDRVRRGAVLGLLGNTGNSNGPHLHFHVMDGPGPLSSNGLPYVFDSFNSEGTSVAAVEQLSSGGSAIIGPALAGHHTRVLPLENQVISFPAAHR